MSCDSLYRRASRRPVELSRNKVESFMLHIQVDVQWISMNSKANVRVFSRFSRAKPSHVWEDLLSGQTLALDVGLSVEMASKSVHMVCC